MNPFHFVLLDEYIRKWTSGFNGPYGICVYGDEVYVVDCYNNRIQVFDLFGASIRSWGSLGSANGQFNNPYGIHVYGDEVYVTDSNNYRVQVFDLYGTYNRKWGSFAPTPPPPFVDGQFQMPAGIFVYGGEAYVTDPLRGDVQVFDLNGNFHRKWGSGLYGAAQGIWVDSGRVFLTDNHYHSIHITDTSGNYITGFGSFGSGNGEFNEPMGICVLGNMIYVVDSLNNRVQIFDSDDDPPSYVTQFGSHGSGDGQFIHPYDCSVYRKGLYVTDSEDNQRVEVFAFPVQGSWRFFQDDAVEPVTPLSGQNVKPTLAGSNIIRLRAMIYAPIGVTGKVSLQYGPPFTDLGPSEEWDYANWRGNEGDQIANFLITPISDYKGKYYESGVLEEGLGLGWTEVDFAIQPTGSAIAGQTYYFRLNFLRTDISEDASEMPRDTGIDYPQVLTHSLPSPGPTNDELMRHLKWFDPTGHFRGCWLGN